MVGLDKADQSPAHTSASCLPRPYLTDQGSLVVVVVQSYLDMYNTLIGKGNERGIMLARGSSRKEGVVYDGARCCKARQRLGWEGMGGGRGELANCCWGAEELLGSWGTGRHRDGGVFLTAWHWKPNTMEGWETLPDARHMWYSM